MWMKVRQEARDQPALNLDMQAKENSKDVEQGMREIIVKAFEAGYERIVAWADVLDRINVYPVPDGDTGRNLVITLSPLNDSSREWELLAKDIMFSARGNSGNIAACFFNEFLAITDLESLLPNSETGRDLAYGAVPNPSPGTILTLFDVLVDSLKKNPPDGTANWVTVIIEELEKAVLATKDQLLELREAGVVDAGALGMFVFFDSFLNTIVGNELKYSTVAETLKDFLELDETWQAEFGQGYCFDVVFKVGEGSQEATKRIMDVDKSAVLIPKDDYLKIHLHAEEKEKTKQILDSIGGIFSWAEDDIGEQTERFIKPKIDQAIHIMTDAAGSLTSEDAATLKISLLNSYITVGNICLPETYVDPDRLFKAMNTGIKVSTSQASIAERYECYNKVMAIYDRVLYLCVGSFYTGNYRVAMDWKAENDPDDRLTVIDTGLASGRLGLATRAVAELSLATADPEEVISFAKKAISHVQEYLFLEKLQFLAAGGRMSKTGAFFGDILRVKPIVSPFPDGVKKMGVARSAKDQVKFLFARLDEVLSKDQEVIFLLQHSDNRAWLENEIKWKIQSRFPKARVIIQPLSLTSASHMGPGTWGVAYLPDKVEHAQSHVN
jgi:DegV family protein with EDD domain